MSYPEIASEFFKSYLPKEILEIIDLSTLKQENYSALSNELGEGISDVLYSVKYGKETGYISLLLEHQSTVRRESCINNCLTEMRPVILLTVIYQYMRSWQRLGVKLLEQCTSASKLTGSREVNCWSTSVNVGRGLD